MSKVENDVKKHVGQNRLCIINIMTVLEFKKRGENNFILILLLCHDSVVTIISLSAAPRKPVLGSPIYGILSPPAGEYSYALFTLPLVEWRSSLGRQQAHCWSQEGECGRQEIVSAKVKRVVGGRRVERQ